MEFLFSSKNLKNFETFIRQDVLVAFDYDGTLAPIVSNPNLAIMRKSTATLFHNLNLVRPLALISGRSVNDMKVRLETEPKYLIGNHGMEWEESVMELSIAQAFFLEIKKSLQKSFDLNKELGITIEDKGYSLSLHYRNSPQTTKAEAVLQELLSRFSSQVKIIPGKFVFNLVLPNSFDKYSALVRVMKKEGCRFGLYFGDDDTDEDVFRVTNPQIMTVRVGWNEKSKAQFFLNDQEEMDKVLGIIIEASK